ncbi:MAG: glycerol-3-phosphate acyltransferase [Anaerolineales bacterium]|nr:glycerol-3-phosphate acyltransferase [Anaerolineales bacterium]
METLPFLLSVIGLGLLGYLSGSLPFSIWITRLVKGVDVRDFGSKHATTTNTIRTVGFGWGALVFVLDTAKGFLPTWLALHVGQPWIASLTAGLVIVGHCWPVFARFRGGMGIASAGGCLLAVSPLAFLLALGLLVALTLILHHNARASLLTGLFVAPLFWLLHLDAAVIWVAAGAGLILVVRFPIDWNRKYRELWLDREQPPGTLPKENER